MRPPETVGSGAWGVRVGQRLRVVRLAGTRTYRVRGIAVAEAGGD